MAEGALPVTALWGVALLTVMAAASRCQGEKPLDTADSAVTETGDTEPHHCVDDTDESPPDSEPPDSEPPDSEPPDTDTHDTAPIDTGPVVGCPSGMVSIGDAFCIDRYEASRPDATAGSAGTDSSQATSRAGVQPWRVTTLSEAEAACAGAGKRLCSPTEWYTTCVGPDETVYPYGDDYEATTCNGIDTYCDCDSTAASCDCESHGDAPYAGCYYACGGTYGVEPTGSFPGCVNGYGVFDISGNLWEYVTGTDPYPVRGGAYNCGDSRTNQRCDYAPTWNPSARGFRCCAEFSR
ncbi:MAG: SUMF1/EgtB/PvdO family nonheme iron enzyme [Pseudomonadota bacterium]